MENHFEKSFVSYATQCIASKCQCLLSIPTHFSSTIFYLFFIFIHCLCQLTLPFSQRNLLPQESNVLCFHFLFFIARCGDGFDSCPSKVSMKTISEKVFFSSDGGKRWVFDRKIYSPELGFIKICSTSLTTHPLAAKTYQYSYILCDFYCLIVAQP